MPATEQTWRDQKLMHVVFGFSSLAMLGTTIWMLAVDHNREWKQDQTEFQQLETWTKAAQLIETNTPSFFGEEARLDEQLYRQQLMPPSPGLVDRFLADVLYDRYERDQGEKLAANDPIRRDFAKLRAVPLSDLSQPEHEKLLATVLAALKAKVNDDTGIPGAYAALTEILTPEKKSTVAAAVPGSVPPVLALAAPPSKDNPPAGDKKAPAPPAADVPADSQPVKIDEALRAQVVAARQDLFSRMRKIISQVTFVEDMTAGQRKFRRADRDAARSQMDIAIRDDAPEPQRKAIQEQVDTITNDVDRLTVIYERAANQHQALEKILKTITGPEDLARKNYTDFQAKQKQLQETVDNETSPLSNFGRDVIEMPILDAFSPRMRIDQIWLPNLTIKYGNFRDVARFDRCTTCHQGIDKTTAGSATAPMYPMPEAPQVVELPTPEKPPAEVESPGAEPDPQHGRTTEKIYGLKLAKRGPIHPNEVTIEVVWPNTPAARVGLMRGDVITEIQVGSRSEKIVRTAQALRFMLHEVAWGQPLKLTVRRGVPQPFAAHPRLDLYVGSLSPHKMQAMGCTICHQGQGSATSFKHASHTPNSLKQQEAWEHDYGYFNNHHWIYPMYPDRFIQSSCLKCHHDVVDLRPSPRFPDPPAPKLIAGYDLIAKVGCFGCHEIIGFDGPKRIGPDMRNEPMYYAAAAALPPELTARVQFFTRMAMTVTKNAHNLALDTAVKSLTDLKEMGQLATKVAEHPDDAPTRLRLLELLQTDAARTAAPDKLLSDPGLTIEMLTLAQDLQAQPDNLPARAKLVALIEADQKSEHPQLRKESYNLLPALTRPPELTPAAQRLADQLKTIETPGTLRKVGPSLRHVASKLGEETVNRWINNPRSIRDSTKMPRFFGLMHDLTPGAAKTASLYEPIEARAISQYLIDKSQPFEYDKPPATVTETPSAERGEALFKTRGCLACHKHAVVPEGAATFGPELTGLDKKINTEKGKEWLRSWLRHPDRYHLRTAMPYNFLDPMPLTDPQGKTLPTPDGRDRMTDPAADIAVWLLGPNWKPVADAFTTLTGSGDDANAKDSPQTPQQKDPRAALDTLAEMYLMAGFPEELTKQYLKDGIPADVGPSLKGAEVELLGPMTQQKKLNYVGRKAISKYGCSGCHDIPGFESARPIGTGLADWGRKETSKLAFEHILEFLPREQAQRLRAQREQQETTAENPPSAAGEHAGPAAGGPHDGHGAAEHPPLDPKAWGSDGFFVAALMEQHREGFLWQKLRQPRSFDYEKTENKGYNEWLRMPQFNLTESEREQIMTFVLGLVSEPPAAQYVYRADARHEALISGEQVLTKFNCAGCHMLDTAQWKIAFTSDMVSAPTPELVPPYLQPYFTPDEAQQSRQSDRRGLMSGHLRGMETLDKTGHPDVSIYWKTDPTAEPEFMSLSDLKGQTIGAGLTRGYRIELWQPTLLDGKAFQPKDPLPMIATRLVPESPGIVTHYPPRGGDFARLLLPIAVAMENALQMKEIDPADAWAWVPPPLVGQGRKTQTEWMHDFLLDPQRIRPGVILRMPRFNMSSDDASALVQYFAARDNADYPHKFTRNDRGAERAADRAYQQKLKQEGLTGTRLGDAEKIVLNKAGCITCHLVDDYTPQGSERAMGPNLANVHRRLQREYVQRWIAKPSLTLPYTKMPVNFPYHPGNAEQDGFWVQAPNTTQKIQPYHGNSLQQIDAVTDLLMNWDGFIEAQTSIRRQIDEAAGSSPAAAPMQK